MRSYYCDPAAMNQAFVKVKQELLEVKEEEEEDEEEPLETPQKRRKVHNNFLEYSPPIIKGRRKACVAGIVRPRLQSGPSVPFSATGAEEDDKVWIEHVWKNGQPMTISMKIENLGLKVWYQIW